MTVGRATTWLALVVGALGGCAQAPKPLYAWGEFPRQQYHALLREGHSSAEQIQVLEAHAQKARAANSELPPGFRAHLGMLYLSAGDAIRARQQWRDELAVFPESAHYVGHLLKRVGEERPASRAAERTGKTVAPQQSSGQPVRVGGAS